MKIMTMGGLVYKMSSCQTNLQSPLFFSVPVRLTWRGFILIALIRILSGAHEFAENAATRPGEEKILKSVDSAIAQELENRFGEKYESGNEVRNFCFVCLWKGRDKGRT